MRKERILREDEWRRLQLDREAGRIELGEGSQATPAVAGERMFLRTEKRLFAVAGSGAKP